MRIPRLRWVAVLAPLLAAWAGGIASASTPCFDSVYAVDPANADTIRIGILGEACGQVVPVSDTLVRAVTFYSPPDLAGFNQGTLWIARTDGTGRPDTHSIVYGGTAPVLEGGDGVAPAHFDFAFDPPIALPGVGQYYFALKSVCPSEVVVLAVKTPAHEGGAWGTGRLCDSGLATLSTAPADPTMNVAMRIVFCAPGATVTARPSWGRVKSIYR